MTNEWRMVGRSCAFTITCESVVPLVVLDSAGISPGNISGYFSDGAFAMVPGEAKEILYTPSGRDDICDLDHMKSVGVSIESLYSLLD